MSKNQLEIDLESNPKLTELLGSKKVGDRCTLSLSLRTIENNGKSIKFTIQKVSSEYDDDEDVEPSSDEPTAMKISDGESKEY